MFAVKKWALLPWLTGAGVSSFAFYEYSKTKSPRYKYIVCGAGTGGCVTAYTLAKTLEQTGSRERVLLIDGGKAYTDPEGPNPVLGQWFENWGKFTQLHESIGDFEASPATTHIGVGGAGAHDTRIAFIPDKDQATRLAAKMNWSESQIARYFQTALDMLPLQSTVDGRGDFYDSIIETLHEAGTLKPPPHYEYGAQIIPNTIGYVSVSMYPDETRWTSALLLHPDVRPKNLDILTESPIDKVLLTNGPLEDAPLDMPLTRTYKYCASGIKLNSGKEVHIKPSGEIAICAGAIGTPAILQRSGIGPRTHLARHNIPVLVDNDEVGHGQDHIEVPVQYKCAPLETVPRGGPMGWPLVLFMGRNDVPGGLTMAHFGISPPPYGGGDVTATPNTTQPSDKDGFRVFITNSDPTVPAYLVQSDANDDFKHLADGVRKTVKMFDVLQERGVVEDRVEPPPELNLDDDQVLDQWMRNNVGTAYHWMATCKSGIAKIVADEHFRVVDEDKVPILGLRVGSGAALPEIPAANPHVTITAFAVALGEHMANLTPQSTTSFGWDELTIRSYKETSPNLYDIAQKCRYKN